eukprot:766690-Prymnesium_polylepis.1
MQTDPTLDELQRSLSESLAQMRQLRQTLNAENADGDLATETEKDDGEAVSWNAEMPAAIESHRTALLGGTPTASESASTGPSGEDPPADKSAETAPPPAGATAGSSEEPVPTAGGGSERTTLDRRNPFFDFVAERLDPLFSCGEPRSQGGKCGACSGKRSKPLPD